MIGYLIGAAFGALFCFTVEHLLCARIVKRRKERPREAEKDALCRQFFGNDTQVAFLAPWERRWLDRMWASTERYKARLRFIKAEKLKR